MHYTIYQKDLNYFEKIDTEEKAYYLGLLYADGHISRSGFSIELQDKDVKVLEDFSKVIFGFVKLSIVKPSVITFGNRQISRRAHFKLSVCSVHIKKQLLKLGLFPKKSSTHNFPTEEMVPKYLLRHFIRGYFDGDGCITHRGTNGNKVPQREVVVLSSRAFCEKLIEVVKNEVGITMTIRNISDKITGVRTGGNINAEKILTWLYKDSRISMKRKEDLYLKLVEDRNLVKSKKSSRYKYIMFHSTTGKWRAYTPVGGRYKYIASCETEEQAYMAQQRFIAGTSLS